MSLIRSNYILTKQKLCQNRVIHEYEAVSGKLVYLITLHESIWFLVTNFSNRYKLKYS